MTIRLYINEGYFRRKSLKKMTLKLYIYERLKNVKVNKKPKK